MIEHVPQLKELQAKKDKESQGNEVFVIVLIYPVTDLDALLPTSDSNPCFESTLFC